MILTRLFSALNLSYLRLFRPSRLLSFGRTISRQERVDVAAPPRDRQNPQSTIGIDSPAPVLPQAEKSPAIVRRPSRAPVSSFLTERPAGSDAVLSTPLPEVPPPAELEFPGSVERYSHAN